uniref:Putative 24 kDa salivary protein n=1 Tax=Corethrella appendiculata TaxID=1370023 RepID=U5EPG2_9DIPT
MFYFNFLLVFLCIFSVKSLENKTNLDENVAKILSELDNKKLSSSSTINVNISTIDDNAGKQRIVARKGVSLTPSEQRDLKFLNTTSATITSLTKPTISVNKSTITTPLSSLTINDKTNPIKELPKNSTAQDNAKNLTITSKSTTSTSTSTTTSTTTQSTTTTVKTTKKPLKPKITIAVEDEPKLKELAKQQTTKQKSDFSIEEPIAQLSQEYPDSFNINKTIHHHEYIISVIMLIFAVPMMIALIIIAYRRAKEFWLTRHYRRMDFLVDGMYNY